MAWAETIRLISSEAGPSVAIGEARDGHRNELSTFSFEVQNSNPQLQLRCLLEGHVAEDDMVQSEDKGAKPNDFPY